MPGQVTTGGPTPMQLRVLSYLESRRASYSHPVPSRELARALRVSPTCAREQAGRLVRSGYVRVRLGKGGGYYLDEAHRAG